MDTHDVERVVVTELVLQTHREGGQDTGDDAEGDRSDRAQRAGSGGDGDQAGDGTGRGTEAGGLAVTDALGEEPAEDGGGGGGGGVDPGQAGSTVGGERGAGVEAEPSEPQQRGTEHDERQVVRTEGGATEAGTLADDDGQDESGDTGVDVHDRATGEVDRLHRGADFSAVLDGAEHGRCDAVLGAQSRPPPDTMWASGKRRR